MTLRAPARCCQDPTSFSCEIRDAETQIATQAALTGHLVLSTLHTNDAPTALTRLLDLEVAAYLVASALDAVLAQRLVRVICPHCKTETTPDKSAHRRIDVVGLGLTTVWKGAGCDECRGTGYRGRTGIYELLVMENDLRLEMQRRRGSEELRAMAVARACAPSSTMARARRQWHHDHRRGHASPGRSCHRASEDLAPRTGWPVATRCRKRTRMKTTKQATDLTDAADSADRRDEEQQTVLLR